jgi:hypothetical protein
MEIKKIYEVPNYKFPPGQNRAVNFSNALFSVSQQHDKHLHLYLDPTEPCMLFGDLDHIPTIDKYREIINMIKEEFGVDSLVTSRSTDPTQISVHWSIPSLWTTMDVLKKIFSQPKFKEIGFVDTSVYRKGQFRLPYQTEASKKFVHEFANKNDAKHFFVQNIDEKAKEFKYVDNVMVVAPPPPSPPSPPSPPPSNVRHHDENLIILEQIIDAGLLSHLSTSYEDWYKMGLAFKSIEAYDLFIRFSETSTSYSKLGCDEFWRSLAKYPITSTIGSIFYQAKQKDKKAYYSIIHTKSQMESEYDMAMIAYKLIDYVVKIEKSFYCFKDGYWALVDNDELRAIISSELRDYVLNMIQSVSAKLTEGSNKEVQDKLDFLKHLMDKNINSTPNSIKIADQFRINMPKTDVKMNQLKPYYFCFKNCAYDLETNKLVQVKKEDFITQHTGYDYVASSGGQVDEIDTLVKSIFPRQESKDCYMSILRSGMCGINPEKFVMANGDGGNGKGLLNELFSEMLGPDYFYKGNCTTLTEPLKGGANPEIANMHLKRTILFSEPRDGSKLQIGVIKDITGGESINARGLYQSNTKTEITGTVILECNQKPLIDGQVGNSAQRRFVNILFDQTFALPNSEGILEDGVQLANPKYKTRDFKSDYKCALFDYLIRIKHTTVPYEPDCIVKETLKYLFVSDEFVGWADSVIEPGGEGDCVKMKDLFTKYKTDHHISRGFTYAKFLEKFQGNIKYKKIYRKNYSEQKRVNGKNQRNILMNYVMIIDDDEESDIEEE